MEWYYIWWPWVTSKRVAWVCQHQLSFLFRCTTLVQRSKLPSLPKSVDISTDIIDYKKLSWCPETCATRYYPDGGKVSASSWLTYHRIACGGSMNVSAGRRVVQHCHCSALSDRQFISPLEWQAPLPVRISQP